VTQIDFYILEPSAAGDRYLLSCRIAEKARGAGHRVIVHSEIEDEKRHLDRLFWTYREDGFVPHGVIGRDAADLNPILIGNGADADDEHDVLINLGRNVPTFFGRFSRMIECIDHDPEIKQAGRDRFRYYREHGYSLRTYNID